MYASSKSYSPRFRYGAELLERTVGSVGKKTGVEDGIRWALTKRRTVSGGDEEVAEPEKRRKTSTSASATDEHGPASSATPPSLTPSHTRRSSTLSCTESLPPYDTFSSPNYDESDRDARVSRSSRPWHNRLIVTTSGLGVAMSDESLRRLTYCLKWLRWANRRLAGAIVSLKRVVEDYDVSRPDEMDVGSPNVAAEGERPSGAETTQSQQQRQLQQLRYDVLHTLKHVVDVVSHYAGGALPENARNLVRRQFTSLPRRFRLASTPGTGGQRDQRGSDTATYARSVLVLAEEGLDIMVQVSGVVNDTLVSAESWCQRLRRKRSSPSAGANKNSGETAVASPSPSQELAPLPDIKVPVPVAMTAEQHGDVEMTGG